MSCICAGDVLPEFTYDTPYAAQNSFYELLDQDERPLFLIFLRNFGHPITRHYVVQYAQTIAELYDARLACVVRSRPEVISENLPEGTLPYPIICDAEGILYDYLEVPMAKNRFTAYSLAGMRILKQARKQGFEEEPDAPQQLPLTLLLDQEGLVLMSHYGTSITDQPENCAAMQNIMNARARQMEKLEKQARRGHKKWDDDDLEELSDKENALYAQQENVFSMAGADDCGEADVVEDEAQDSFSFQLEEPAEPQMPQEPQIPVQPEQVQAEAPTAQQDDFAQESDLLNVSIQSEELPKRVSPLDGRNVEEESVRKYGDVAAALFQDAD